MEAESKSSSIISSGSDSNNNNPPSPQSTLTQSDRRKTTATPSNERESKTRHLVQPVHVTAPSVGGHGRRIWRSTSTTSSGQGHTHTKSGKDDARKRHIVTTTHEHSKSVAVASVVQEDTNAIRVDNDTVVLDTTSNVADDGLSVPITSTNYVNIPTIPITSTTHGDVTIPIGLATHDVTIPVGLAAHNVTNPIGLATHDVTILIDATLHDVTIPIDATTHHVTIPIASTTHDVTIPIASITHDVTIPIASTTHDVTIPIEPLTSDDVLTIPVASTIHVFRNAAASSTHNVLSTTNENVHISTIIAVGEYTEGDVITIPVTPTIYDVLAIPVTCTTDVILATSTTQDDIITIPVTSITNEDTVTILAMSTTDDVLAPAVQNYNTDNHIASIVEDNSQSSTACSIVGSETHVNEQPRRPYLSKQRKGRHWVSKRSKKWKPPPSDMVNFKCSLFPREQPTDSTEYDEYNDVRFNVDFVVLEVEVNPNETSVRDNVIVPSGDVTTADIVVVDVTQLKCDNCDGENIIAQNEKAPDAKSKSKKSKKRRLKQQLARGDNMLHEHDDLPNLAVFEDRVSCNSATLIDAWFAQSTTTTLRTKKKWRGMKARLQVKEKHCLNVKNVVHGRSLYMHHRVSKLMVMAIQTTRYQVELSMRQIDKTKGIQRENLPKRSPSTATQHNALELKRHARHVPPPQLLPMYAVDAFNADDEIPAELINVLITLQHRDLMPEDYELLLALDERVQPKTVSKEQLELLRTEVVEGTTDDPTGSVGQELCAVCFERYEVGQLRKYLPCGHYFHSTCIDSWLSNSSMNCPLDGTPIEL